MANMTNTVSVKVAGITFNNEDGIARKSIVLKAKNIVDETGIKPLVKIEREPNNKYDPNAIKVMFNNEQIGYVPKDIASAITPMIDAGLVHITAEYEDAGMWLPQGKKKELPFAKITLTINP